MNLTAFPGAPLQGTVSLPGDKSLSHRAALFAALAEGESRIENFLVSGVTQVLLDALTALGAAWSLEGGALTVQGRGLRGLRPPAAALDCGSSATTIRLLAGALAAAGVPAVLDGSEGLRRRPMERIAAPLRQMGVPIETADGCAPLSLGAAPRPLRALDYTLPVASAQLKTCLLLAALAAGGPTTLREPGPSRDHTERMLKNMGVKVESEKRIEDGRHIYQTRLTPPQPLSLNPLHMTLPGDFSSAAFLIVAALITPGSSVTIRNVGLNATRTGLLDALLAMGGDICISNQASRGGEPSGDLIVHHSRLRPADISGEQVVRMIDEFPVFAVAAAHAEGESRVRDAAELRHKESDRIARLCEELRGLGIDAHESADGFTIRGGAPVRGGLAHPHGDHRLAMSLAAAGLAASEPVEIEDAEIIGQSFPEFIDTLRALGGRLAVKEQAHAG